MCAERNLVSVYAAAFQINHARFTSLSCLLELLLPPGTAPGRPPARGAPFPGWLLQPIPAASGRRLPSGWGLGPSSSVGRNEMKEKKRKETKGNETRGRAALAHPGTERGARPEQTRRVSAPPAAQAGSGARGGCFCPFPARDQPKLSVF